MAIVRYTLDPKNPPRLSAEAQARLEAMTEEEIQRNAEADPDNPPMTEAEADRFLMGRRVRRIREAAGLSQAEFAARFRINAARLRDWEQGRTMPDSAARAYLEVIANERKAVERALTKAS